MEIRCKGKPEGPRELGAWGGDGLIGLVYSFHFRSVSCAGEYKEARGSGGKGQRRGESP